MTDQPKEHRRLFAKHIIRKIFFEDWALKLTALVITLGLWLGVTGLSTPTTKRLSVPLNLSISSNAQVTNIPQQEVDIEISGDKRKIDQINRGDMMATIDLTDVPPGDRVVSLSPDNVFVPLPQGVKLVEVTPSRIAVSIESVEEKEVDVKVQVEGAPAVGYEVYSTTVIPARIRVRGPSSIMSGLMFVETERIDISDRKEDFTARQIGVGTGDVKATVLNTVVDVVFRIGERRIERSFTIPIDGDGLKTASFVAFGPRSLVSRIRTDELKAEMYLNDNGEVAARVELPPDLQGLVQIRNLRVSQ